MTDGPTFDDAELNEAWVNYAMANAGDDDNSDEFRNALNDILDLAAEKPPMVRSEVVDLIKNTTDWNTNDIRSELNHRSSKSNKEEIEFQSVKKIIPDDPDADPRYELHLTYDGDPGTLYMAPGDFTSMARFNERIFSTFDKGAPKMKSEIFTEMINEEMDRVNIERIEQDPTEPEHAVVENVLSRMRSIEVTEDDDAFFQNPRSTLLHDPASEEVLVSAKLIDSAASDISSSDVPATAVAGVFEKRGFFTDPDAPVREMDDMGFRRAWALSPSKLVDVGVLKPEQLNDDDNSQ